MFLELCVLMPSCWLLLMVLFLILELLQDKLTPAVPLLLIVQWSINGDA